ncbi:MAG: putative DNA binding domain-containing protein [Bacteroidetes bacterium]|nr:putative DNA binding domain-containing protein [Bacteroidota bacterium]
MTSALHPDRARRALDTFDWDALFIDELGWNRPGPNLRTFSLNLPDDSATFSPVAQVGGTVAYRVVTASGAVPNKKLRENLHRAAAERTREHLLVFENSSRTQALWSYPRTEGKKLSARDHLYVKGQPADLFLSLLAGIAFDLSELDDDGRVDLLTAKSRIEKALDVQAVTKKFYAAFRDQQAALHTQHLSGLDGERDRRHFASVLLTRLMFVYFLQKKGFLLLPSGSTAEHVHYLDVLFERHRAEGHADSFYRRVLRPLFFDAFARPHPDAATRALLGRIPYLNGGLFLEHPLEEHHPALDVADDAIAGILDVFGGFTWHLDDSPGGQADEINPDVLGYILEKYVNQKAFGAYYTPPEITTYLCDATLDRFLLDAVHGDADAHALLDANVPGLTPTPRFDSLNDLLVGLDDALARRLVFEILPGLSVLDPACGSGAFLVAALKKLVTVYTALYGHAEVKASDPQLKAWVDEAKTHGSRGYVLKRQIVTHNLYGVDLMPEAVEIARLRLFLALVSSAQTVDQLEPLPNIDFNLLAGNSLVGLLDVSEEAILRHGGNLFTAQEFGSALVEKQRLVRLYRGTAEKLDRHDTSGALQHLRDDILAARATAQTTLDQLLTDEFRTLKIKVEQATWTGKKATSTKRDVTRADIAALTPFHWAYEFPDVMKRGGFDVVLANPPWDVLKPNDKEFFEQHSDAVSKNTMRIEDFLAHRDDLLRQNDDLRADYERYLTTFPHQSAYVRTSPQYQHQSAVVNGKRTGTDPNLYKLFLERGFHLARPGGHFGLVVPSGLYTDLGAKGLRQMFFEQTTVTGLFGFENRRGIFEDVDSRFKFVVVTAEKGGTTTAFPTAFMRHDVAELRRFPREGALQTEVQTVKALSPDAWGLMEFSSEADLAIAQKMAAFPALGDDDPAHPWQLRLTAEFHMTNDSDLFETAGGPGRLPLYEGKMMHQFTHTFAEPRYWVDEAKGRTRALGARGSDGGQALGYQSYRIAHRSIARSTDARTMIATVLPPGVFCGHSLNVSRDGLKGQDLLLATALLDSLVVDYALRMAVSANLTMQFIYQLPVPRLASSDRRAKALAHRAARLVCTAPAYDALARSAGLRGHDDGATDPAERARLRAELDGLVAHLYGLTEAEFAHVLATFPLVAQPVKDAALQAYRAAEAGTLEPGFARPVADDPSAAALVSGGESSAVEFKETLRTPVGPPKHPSAPPVPPSAIEHAAVKTLAAFLNSAGGTLFVGVADDGTSVGLAPDGFPNEDKWLLHLDNLVTAQLGGAAHAYVTARIVPLGGVRVARVDVRPSDAPVFCKGKDGEAFYVRASAGTRQLTGSDLLAYTKQRFG